jgi:hypothetical protein
MGNTDCERRERGRARGREKEREGLESWSGCGEKEKKLYKSHT